MQKYMYIDSNFLFLCYAINNFDALHSCYLYPEINYCIHSWWKLYMFIYIIVYACVCTRINLNLTKIHFKNMIVISMCFYYIDKIFFLQIINGHKYEKDYIYRLLMSYIKPTPFYPVGVSFIYCTFS